MKYACDHCESRSDILVVLNECCRVIRVAGKNVSYGADVPSFNAPDGFYCSSCRHPLLDDNGTVMSDVFKLVRLLHVQGEKHAESDKN